MMVSLPLVVPLVLCGCVIACLLLLCFRCYKSAVVLVVLAVVLNHKYHSFAIPSFSLSDEKAISIKVMTFNVEGLDDRIFEKVEGLADIILKEDADILVLQENAHWTDVLNVLMDERYSYCSDSLGKCETILYSKYPIVKSTNFKIKGCNATVINCNISVHGKLIDVYGCHLCSSNYGEDKDRIDPDSISGYTTLTRYLDNYSRCDSLRASEADSICTSIEATKHPTLVLGDFNCPDGSQATNILSSYGMNDAWWEKGFGYGATIHHPLPFRIDHIYFGKEFKVESVKKIESNGLSDHDALVGELEF